MDIVLVCSGGVSAAIFMKKLKMLAKEKQIAFTLSACSLSQLKAKVDVLLLSPQVAYAKKQLRCYVESEDHILLIDSFSYSSLNAHQILDQIMKIQNIGG